MSESVARLIVASIAGFIAGVFLYQWISASNLGDYTFAFQGFVMSLLVILVVKN